VCGGWYTQFLTGSAASKSEFWRPMGRWSNSTIRDLKKIWRYFVDWVHLAQDSD
jgi:hypothetical protein